MCGGHHHDHHDHHHVDHHHVDHHHVDHHVADHHEISRLNVETGRLIKERAVLRTAVTKSDEQIAELKNIEGELRNNVEDLLKEMDDKEKLAAATNDELRENITALTSLLSSREEDLASEVEKTAALQATNDELTATSEGLKTEGENLTGELTAAKENMESTLAKNEIEVNELKLKIAELCEPVCAPVVVHVDRHHHSHC